MRFLTLILAIVWSAAAAFAGPQQPQHSHEAGQEAQQPRHIPTDDVVVRVQAKPITEKEVMVFIDQVVGARQMDPEQVAQRYSIFFEAALEDLVGLALLSAEAKNTGIKIEPKELDEAIQSAKKRFTSEEEFKKALEREGIREADLRTQIEEELMIQRVILRATKDAAAVTDEEIKKFYEANPAYFDGGKRPLPDAQADIRASLENRSKQTLIRKHVEQLKTGAKIERVMSDEEWAKRHGKAPEPGGGHRH